MDAAAEIKKHEDDTRGLDDDLKNKMVLAGDSKKKKIVIDEDVFYDFSEEEFKAAGYKMVDTSISHSHAADADDDDDDEEYLEWLNNYKSGKQQPEEEEKQVQVVTIDDVLAKRRDFLRQRLDIPPPDCTH